MSRRQKNLRLRTTAYWADRRRAAAGDPAELAQVAWDQLRAAASDLPVNAHDRVFRRISEHLDHLRQELPYPAPETSRQRARHRRAHTFWIEKREQANGHIEKAQVAWDQVRATIRKLPRDAQDNAFRDLKDDLTRRRTQLPTPDRH